MPDFKSPFRLMLNRERLDCFVNENLPQAKVLKNLDTVLKELGVGPRHNRNYIS